LNSGSSFSHVVDLQARHTDHLFTFTLFSRFFYSGEKKKDLLICCYRFYDSKVSVFSSKKKKKGQSNPSNFSHSTPFSAHLDNNKEQQHKTTRRIWIFFSHGKKRHNNKSKKGTR